MTGQDIADMVKVKCALTEELEARYEGLTVLSFAIENLPLDALSEYAKISGRDMEYKETPQVMRVHYSTINHCVFLDSVPVKVETKIVEVQDDIKKEK